MSMELIKSQIHHKKVAKDNLDVLGHTNPLSSMTISQHRF